MPLSGWRSWGLCHGLWRQLAWCLVHYLRPEFPPVLSSGAPSAWGPLWSFPSCSCGPC